MIRIKPNVRSVGSGPAVVLLHSSGSSSRQWQPLMDNLQSRFRLHAVDLHGHGATPAWSGERPLTLEDDAALIEPLLAAAADGVHLVGHSYGGGVALKLAQLHPQRVRSVSVFEPVLFRLLFDYNARHAPAQEIIATDRAIRTWLALGFEDTAAQRFVDYWSGEGSWEAMPPARREAISARLPAIVPHFHALFNESLTRAQLGRIAAPTLVLTGARTRASTRRIGELLRLAMPQATHEMLAGMGHMGPITHGSTVNARIAGFLDAHVMLREEYAPLLAAA
jgi:pimeloyl-ACP methyl ester carboxylesterase